MCHVLLHELNLTWSLRKTLDTVVEGSLCSECDMLLQRLVDSLRAARADADTTLGILLAGSRADGKPGGWERVPRTKVLQGLITTVGPDLRGLVKSEPRSDP